MIIIPSVYIQSVASFIYLFISPSRRPYNLEFSFLNRSFILCRVFTRLNNSLTNNMMLPNLLLSHVHQFHVEWTSSLAGFQFNLKARGPIVALRTKYLIIFMYILEILVILS